MEDRGFIEGLFLMGDFLVFCMISILVQGVNLLVYVVIIKFIQYQ